MPCNCDSILAATQHLTPCECAGPGFCARHNVDKGPHWHGLCKTRMDYFAQWEQGRGPGQVAGRLRREIRLGDVVAWLIGWATRGRLKMCDACNARKAWLNRVRIWPLWRKQP